ncbi:hypothetical protein YB2330_004700 [Saitoella coloradoensis]
MLVKLGRRVRDFPMLFQTGPILGSRLQFLLKESERLKHFNSIRRGRGYPCDLKVQPVDPYFKTFCQEYEGTDVLLHKYRKWGRPAATNEVMLQNLKKFGLDRPEIKVGKSKVWKFAFARTCKAFKLADKLRPPDLSNPYTVDSTLSSGAGFPYFQKKAAVKDELFTEWTLWRKKRLVK